MFICYRLLFAALFFAVLLFTFSNAEARGYRSKSDLTRENLTGSWQGTQLADYDYVSVVEGGSIGNGSTTIHNVNHDIGIHFNADQTFSVDSVTFDEPGNAVVTYHGEPPVINPNLGSIAPLDRTIFDFFAKYFSSEIYSFVDLTSENLIEHSMRWELRGDLLVLILHKKVEMTADNLGASSAFYISPSFSETGEDTRRIFIQINKFETDKKIVGYCLNCQEINSNNLFSIIELNAVAE